MENRDFEIDEDQGRCSDCGQPLPLAAERCCSLSEITTLCWDCALRRGGIYDSDQDRWSVLPDAGDLEESARRLL